MDRIKMMLLENKAWAKSRTDIDPQFFQNMADSQAPTFLWIGCSDSRVPPSEITNTDPGEMFVHRNIANLVLHTDMNLLSVIEYAVNVLKVPHIIICGHYGCGGVRAALMPNSLGLIDNWVRNIKDVYHDHLDEIEMIKTEGEQVNRLVELNVMDQVKKLSYTSIIQKAWKQNNLPYIHGWVYDITNGQLKEINRVDPRSVIDKTHRYDN